MKELLKAALLIFELGAAYPELEEIFEDEDLREDEAIAKALLEAWPNAEREYRPKSMLKAAFNILIECADVYLGKKRDINAIKAIIDLAEDVYTWIAPYYPFNHLITQAVKFIKPDFCLLLGAAKAEALAEELSKIKTELSTLKEEKTPSLSLVDLEKRNQDLEEELAALREAKMEQEEKFNNEQVLNDATNAIRVDQCRRLREENAKLRAELKLAKGVKTPGDSYSASFFLLSTTNKSNQQSQAKGFKK